MPIILIVLLVLGIAVGTAAPLWMQGIIFLVIIIYNMSDSVRAMELGAILPMIMSMAFIVGMFIGDISFVVQTGGVDLKGIPNPFVVGD